MEGFGPVKLKRKDLEDVNDDFSDFSLSSPARKIRRLDAILPLIIEEEPEIPIEQPVHQDNGLVHGPSGGLKIEELPSEPYNNEKAIVLFNPMNNIPPSLSNYSVAIDPNFISPFKNKVPWANQSNHWRLTNGETMENNNSNSCLAVVPWVPPQPSTEAGLELPSETEYAEMMDAQETEEETMDIEESTDGGTSEQRNASGKIWSEGFHQWQQQHCLIPQAPQNSTAPIVWYK